VLSVNDIDGFEWDEGNQDKNWLKLQVSNSECEELFFNFPLLIASDPKHSQTEQRYYALGQTNEDRWLFIAFTIRKNKIRGISDRDMSPNERKAYAKANP
jgi:uncharacterized DUF497 family protein